ncbi:hypothetical protein D9M73_114220 [compost metagenome]
MAHTDAARHANAARNQHIAQHPRSIMRRIIDAEAQWLVLAPNRNRAAKPHHRAVRRAIEGDRGRTRRRRQRAIFERVIRRQRHRRRAAGRGRRDGDGQFVVVEGQC